MWRCASAALRGHRAATDKIVFIDAFRKQTYGRISSICAARASKKRAPDLTRKPRPPNWRNSARAAPGAEAAIRLRNLEATRLDGHRRADGRACSYTPTRAPGSPPAAGAIVKHLLCDRPTSHQHLPGVRILGPLNALAAARGMSLAALVAEIDAGRGGANLSSAIRVFVLQSALAQDLAERYLA